ncbi:helix-turn-helix domain-containing protein [Streptomyces sp. NPDC050997]|uniref:helix-turn-helix domain-containing protein n=1 Tax=Streptomyces sp. NPDC050997 TaxID=3155519 RepID=UPI0034281DF5
MECLGCRPWPDEDGGTVSTGDDVAEFAALLRELKARTDRSYGSLARRLNMNTSTLHRYCSGDAVPLDFAPVERFAAFCAATPEERLELHRRWLLAAAARRRPRTADGATEDAADGADDMSGPGDDTPDPGKGTPELIEGAEGSVAAPGAGSGVVVPGAGSRPGVGEQRPSADRPWYRRRQALLGAAVATVLLATLGSLAALSADRPPADTVGTAPDRAPTTDTDKPHRPAYTTLSPSPSASPGRSSTSSPSPSADARASTTPGKKNGPSAAAQGDAPASDVQPLAWTADSQVWNLGCGHDYVIDKTPQQVPPPPVQQDAGTWAATQDAVHGHETIVRISVQGRSSTAVVLDALRVRVVGRAAPASGNAFAMDQGCGGELTPRSFAVNLDADRPVVRSLPGADSEHTIPAVHFPYRVSAEDPEVLLVSAQTDTCDCQWYLELDWSSQGRSGTIRIDDHGRPFRTSGIKGLPRYMYDTSGRRWTPYA